MAESHWGDPTLSKVPGHIPSHSSPSGSALIHLCLFVTVLNQILLDLLSTPELHSGNCSPGAHDQESPSQGRVAPVPLAVELGLDQDGVRGVQEGLPQGLTPPTAALGPPLSLGILASASEVRDCIWEKLEV